MEEQRWVKASTNTLSGELQDATTLAEFGQRLISRLMPMLGGGVANFYLFENEPEQIRRIAAMGWQVPGALLILSAWARAWSANANKPRMLTAFAN
jgi:hypothetical protein